MKFIKKHPLFCSIIALSLSLFVVLFFFKISEKNSNEDLIQSIEGGADQILTVKETINALSYVEKDVVTSGDDLKTLITKQKNIEAYFNAILQRESNFYQNPKHKSSTSVNAKITRLFSQLTNLCEKNYIKLGNEINPSTLGSTIDAQKSFGFGFTKYDGFWPSFSDNEVLLLGVQADIIKLIFENLAGSTEANSTVRIMEVRRESVGPVDERNVGQNILKINKAGPSLMRECEGLNSLAIELQIKCKTNVLRKFINNCKPPLLINCLNVSTPSLPNTTNNPATLDPFAPPNLATPTPDHVPIVSVVDCVAVITFEYVTSIDFGLADMFSQTKEDADFRKFSEAFLKATGNDHIITTLKNEKALR